METVFMEETAVRGRKVRYGGIALWGWVFSIAVHAAAAVVLSCICFSGGVGAEPVRKEPAVSVEQIKRFTSEQTAIPKPTLAAMLPLQGAAVDNRLVDDAFQREDREDGTREEPAVRNEPVMPYSAWVWDETEFFGQKTDKRKICYVVDCSGSMYGRLGEVQKQLKNSIGSLKGDQFFYIIFFLEGQRLIESGGGRLLRASENNKSRAYDFIESARLGGTTDAVNALTRAMQIIDSRGKAAEVIYFLTDGFDLQESAAENSADEIEGIRKKLAPDTIINTIGIWTEPADRKILQEMALSSGGRFVNVE